VQVGRFRGDLLYRLRVFQINIPPLRARGEDVLLLAERFLSQLAARYAKPAPALAASAREALLVHNWPGNVRELRNVIERAVLLNAGGALRAEDLVLGPRQAGATHGGRNGAEPATGSLEAVERRHLVRALEQAEWNVTRAAKLLDISRDTLRYRIEKHGLQRPQAPDARH
jgi:two-component system, NtrC family, response regulator AtoC